MVMRGGPLRLAYQRSRVRLQIPNSAASSAGVRYSLRMLLARSTTASADPMSCSATFLRLQITWRDAGHITECPTLKLLIFQIVINKLWVLVRPVPGPLIEYDLLETLC